MKARIRSVKPEVHKDEELWDVEQRSGLPLFRVFLGLWNYSDREGRFEWKPRVLKTDVLPWWDGDFETAMNWLTPKFIVKYEVEGRVYGWVRTFKKHQVINNREEDSRLPPPPMAALAANNNGAPPPAPPTPPAETPANPAADSGGFAPPADASPTRAHARISAAATRAARVGDACPTPLVRAQVEGKGRELDLEGKGTTGGAGTRGARVGHASMFDSAQVVRVFSTLRSAHGGGTYQLKRTDYDRAQAAVAWALEEQPDDPLAAVTQSIANFLQYARGKEAREFWGWANDPGKWFTTSEAPGNPMGRVGSQEEFERDANNNPSWLEDGR